MLVIVNDRCRAAAGTRQWGRIRDALVERGIAFEEIHPAGVEASDQAVIEGIASGHDVVVAAGGDGTVAAVLNAMIDPATDRVRQDIALGAIGLGSSNDFHKPHAPERSIAGLPARLSAASAEHVDVGRARVRGPDGSEIVRYFLLNASVGVVSDGNDFFNTGTGMVRWLKRKNADYAISFAAMRSILRHRPRHISLSIDGAPVLDQPVTNIGILKSVHFTGGLRYDTGVTRDDGQFDVNIMEAMGRMRLLATAAALGRGQFSGRPGTRCLRGRVVQLEAEEAAPLELDGEIFSMHSAELEVIPRAVRVCG